MGKGRDPRTNRWLMSLVAAALAVAGLSVGEADATVIGPPSELTPIDISSARAVEIDPATGYFHYLSTDSDIVLVRTAVGENAGIGSYGGPELVFPWYMAVSGDLTFVTDRVGLVHRYDHTTGAHLGSWGGSGSGPGQFDDIAGVDVYNDEVYVADTNNARIQVFNLEGAWQRTLVGSGLAPVRSPEGIVIHEGELYVADPTNQRVRILDPNTGDTSRTFHQTRPASGIDITSTGDVFLLVPGDSGSGDELVDVYTTGGALQTSFNAPGAGGQLKVDPLGDSVWVGAPGSDIVRVFSWLSCFGVSPTYVGTSYDDTIVFPGLGGQRVALGPGDDDVWLGGGDDFACGDAGNDTIRGEAGNDSISGGSSPDVLLGGPGDDTLLGGDGADLLRGGGGDDFLLGHDGPDTIAGQGGADTIDGGGGADTIDGQGAGDTISGGPGNDTINGQNGADVILAGPGADSVKTQTGPDELRGQGDDDELFGGNGADVLYGGAGFDRCSGNTGPDSAEAATCEQTPGVETLF